MARGRKSKVGDTRVAANGYHYTRTEEGWVLTHRLVAERALGRPLRHDERVRFKDGDRTNYADPDNLEVYTVKKSSIAKRRARIEARIEELKAELAALAEEESKLSQSA